MASSNTEKQYDSYAIEYSDPTDNSIHTVAFIIRLDETYDSLEEWLNAVASENVSAFLKKMKMNIHATVGMPTNSNNNPPPFVTLYGVKMRSNTDFKGGDAPGSANWPDLASHIKNQLNDDRYLQDIFFLGDLEPIQYVSGDSYHFKGDITIKGDNNNFNYMHSDEWMSDPEGRTHIVALISSHAFLNSAYIFAKSTQWVKLQKELMR
jgi:hypothetical protein